MLKQYLKSVLPGRVWRGLARIKLACINAWKRSVDSSRYAAVSLILLPIRALPTQLQASVKERLEPVRNMDYRRAAIRMAVNSEWQHYRLRSASKEPETIDWIERTLREDDVFYDIGANVGAYSFVASAVTTGRATIYAFEPGFSTFPELCRNIVLNSANDHIVPLQVGLGAETGLSNFIYSELNAGAAMHAWEGMNAWEGVNGSQVARVAGNYVQSTPCYRLDDLIPILHLNAPNVVKIDVDGAEYEVLLGAKRTLSDITVRSILIEFDDVRLSLIGSLLQSYGFALDQVHQRGMTWSNYIYKRAAS